MKAHFGIFVGALGILFIPLAIVFVAFRASCNFVSRIAMEGLHDD
jgi:hypothetical protein